MEPPKLWNKSDISAHLINNERILATDNMLCIVHIPRHRGILTTRS